MHNSERPGTPAIVYVGAGLTFFAIAVTIGIAFAVTTAPRGFLFGVVVVFLCIIELLVGLTSIGSLSAKNTSAPTSIATGVLVGLYGLAGIVTIAVASSGDKSAARDTMMCATLVGETAVFIIIAVFMIAFDSHARVQEAPALQKKQEHYVKSLSVKDALSIVSRLKTDDMEAVRMIDSLKKRLFSIESALSHSHGGRSGSVEGRQTAMTQDADERLSIAVDNLGGLANNIGQSSAGDVKPQLAAIRKSVEEIERIIENNNLL